MQEGKEEQINFCDIIGGGVDGGEESEKRVKRGRPEDLSPGDGVDPGDVPSPKRRARSHDVLFRIVVPSRQIGRVIGRAGNRIRMIREETKAAIKIADAVSRHEERVIIISSTDDDMEISDAENALHRIASVILQENNGEPSKVSPGTVGTNLIRLLIAGSQAGCLIGKSGQNIENIRNSSGATIMILPQNQLPLCASAHESDRLVQISGNIPEVLKALEKIGCQLRENPPRKVISIRPVYNFSSNSSVHPFVAPNSADYVTTEMTIPEALVGGLIGKCGYNISRIRNQSGAVIKGPYERYLCGLLTMEVVTGGKGEQDQRQIHFGGSAHQVTLARQLVTEYLYSQSL